VYTSTTASSIVSNYSSALTHGISERDSQTNKYFESINISVNTTGYYSLTSLSPLDSYACLYQDSFDSSNSSSNRRICDDQSGVNNQFKFSVYLQSGIPYTLVFTTFWQGDTGEFTIVGNGPDQIDFSPKDILETTTLGKSNTCK
jgi:hypothetical protein